MIFFFYSSEAVIKPAVRIADFIWFSASVEIVQSGALTSFSHLLSRLMAYLVGPGLGSTIGPEGNFNGIPVGAKWVLITAMLIGRLELFTVLVLIMPQFWKK